MISRNFILFFRLFAALFLFSILTSSCNSKEQKFRSYMDSVSIADSIFYLRLKQDTTKPDTAHFRENSLFNFPFLLNEKRNLFHHKKIGNKLSIHIDDFHIDSLKSLSSEEYSRIIHDPNEALNPGKFPFDNNWFYYSIEDTSKTKYWTFTILYFKEESDFELFLVYMKKDGTYSDNLSVTLFHQDSDFYRTPSRSRSSSEILSDKKMTSDFYYEIPNDESDPDKKHAGKNFLATIGHYHFNFTISEEGKLTQDTMTTKEKRIYSDSQVESLFR